MLSAISPNLQANIPDKQATIPHRQANIPDRGSNKYDRRRIVCPKSIFHATTKHVFFGQRLKRLTPGRFRYIRANSSSSSQMRITNWRAKGNRHAHFKLMGCLSSLGSVNKQLTDLRGAPGFSDFYHGVRMVFSGDPAPAMLVLCFRFGKVRSCSISPIYIYMVYMLQWSQRKTGLGIFLVSPDPLYIVRMSSLPGYLRIVWSGHSVCLVFTRHGSNR